MFSVKVKRHRSNQMAFLTLDKTSQAESDATQGKYKPFFPENKLGVKGIQQLITRDFLLYTIIVR